MSFEVTNVQTTETQSNKPTVNFDELNSYVVNTCQLQQPETLLGVVSVIADLGTQKLPDAEYDLDKEDEGLSIEELTAKHSNMLAENHPADKQVGKITKFGKSYDGMKKEWVIRKFVKQADRQAVAMAIDFPDIMLDKGQFFGETEPNPKPLRLWMGGQYWNKFVGEKGKMLIQNVIPLKVTNIAQPPEKVWSMNPKSVPHKMAVAAKIVETGEAFLPQDIDKLLGKTLQFKAQVFFNKSKDGKQYYTEKVSFAAGLARGQTERQVDKTYLIQFNKENDLQALKELRAHVINTIEQATNYEGSVIQKQLAELRGGVASSGAVSNGGTTSVSNTEAPKQQVVKQPTPTAIPEESYVDDESLPF